MQVAITDYTFPTLDVEREVLAGAADIVDGQCKSPEQLIALTQNADAVIAQFAPITREVIRNMQRARVIVRYGIGVDNVDLEAARECGIPVCNIPSYCIDEVADHTLALMLAATRQIVRNGNSVQQGKWKLAVRVDEMRTLRDLTVGVVGFGRIGREVVARLAPFKCRCLVFDPVVPEAVLHESGAEPASLDALLAQSDVVTLHCPSGPKTRRMINADSLARMKPGAILVNLSRGDLVDTEALVAALQDGRLGAAAIDVCDPEPVPADHPLLQLPSVIATAHIASVSVKAVRTLRESAAKIALAGLRGEALPNIVNGVTSQRFA